jgi:hypothetical protein
VAKKPKDDYAAILAQMREEEKKEEQQAKEELKRIGGELFLEGVATVVAAYDGQDDSGDMESVLYYASDETCIDEPKKAIVAHEEELKTALWHFIPSGFENNEGGYGEVTFKIADNKITCEHNQRIEEIVSSSRDYNL